MCLKTLNPSTYFCKHSWLAEATVLLARGERASSPCLETMQRPHPRWLCCKMMFILEIWHSHLHPPAHCLQTGLSITQEGRFNTCHGRNGYSQYNYKAWLKCTVQNQGCMFRNGFWEYQDGGENGGEYKAGKGSVKWHWSILLWLGRKCPGKKTYSWSQYAAGMAPEVWTWSWPSADEVEMPEWTWEHVEEGVSRLRQVGTQEWIYYVRPEKPPAD